MESDRLVVSATSDGINIRDGAQRMRANHGRTTGPTRRSTKGQWTAEEDEILRKAVQRFKGKNWKKIAECFKDRTDVQCLHRWQKVLNPELVKGPWSKEEDEIITELVKKFGPKKWSTIAQHLPGRIGKQCRERWHNHLNPGINKEAWTQEEELALIRAHQLYGNRWAELTKFLPGRTDNAIKNHWNSSVKKKLDSYLASGLLDQFQQFPLVAYQNQHIPSSSSRMQSSVDESTLNGRTDAEEISECSQEESASGLAVVMHPGDQFQHMEMTNASRDQIPGPASCSEPYYASLDGTAFYIPDVSCEAGCSSMFHEQNFSHDGGASASVDYQFNLQHANMSSLEMGHCSSGLTTHSIGNIGGQELVYAPNFMENMDESPDKQEHLLITATDDDCFRILFSETADDGCFSSGNYTESLNLVNLDACTNPSPSRPSEQISDTGRIPDSLSPCPSTEVSGTSVVIPAPSILPADSSILICGREHGDSPLGTQGQDFICTDDPANSPCHDTDKESLKLVPVNSFGSRSDANESCPPPVVEKPKTDTEQDAGALCYEPPRFPSLDIPFFSCDLVQSGSDMQQEYSPLGIRQLMTNSTHCITPFRLWDSPRDDYPGAVLKSAAKTFTGTPSILKKRHRDLLSPSPLSERRIDKKLETDLTSNLAKDFSRLDVEFDNGDTQKLSQLPQTDDHKNNSNAPPIDDKENLSNAHAEREDGREDTTALSDDKETIENDAETMVDADAHQNSYGGVLVDHNINDLLLFSPDQAGSRVERTFASTSRTLKNQLHKNSGVLSTQPHASENSSLVQGTTSSSAPLEISVANRGNDAASENYIIFGETPFKRSIESPSAWKSPWFLNSFLPGQMEDIGYLLSPGDKGYDAIGLMKQLSDFSAPSYADAMEVLGNETPETLIKQKRDLNPDMNKENNNVPQDQTESCLHLQSNNLTERRMLDFSECGTPGKGIENRKSAVAISSPSSSYLLKGCR